jgi:hypothetical protein
MNEWKELGGEEERGGFAIPTHEWRKLRKRGGGGGEREAGRVWNYMCQRKSNNTIALSSVVVVVGCCWCAIALATTYLHSFVVVGKLGCSPPPPPQIPYQYFFPLSLSLSLSHSFSTPFHPLSVAVELHTSFDLVPWKQEEDQTEREKEIVVVVVVVVVVVAGGFCQEDFQVS